MSEYWHDDHNIELVPEKYRHIVKVLLDREDILSDGYQYYCDFYATEQAGEYYNGDYVLAALVELAKEILGEV